MEYKTVYFGKDIRYWCYLMMFAAVINVLNCVLVKDYFSVVTSLAAGLLFYWLLKSRRRLAFYLILALFGILMVFSILVRIHLLPTLVNQGIPPLVTFIFLKKYWPFMK